MAGKLGHIEFPAQDVDRATKFYSGLFGWQFKDSGMPGIDYRMFEGEPPGAVYPAQSGEKGPNIYFITENIDDSIAKARELGGEADDKQPIPTVGWFAVCKDTEGNPFRFFQSDPSVAPPEQ